MNNKRMVALPLILILIAVIFIGCLGVRQMNTHTVAERVYVSPWTEAAPPLYVIDVEKLAGTEPETAEQLLKEMVPCERRHEHRWQEGQGDDRDITGKLFNRVYEIENGQVDRWGRKPGVTLFFDPDYEEPVNQVRFLTSGLSHSPMRSSDWDMTPEQ